MKHVYLLLILMSTAPSGIALPKDSPEEMLRQADTFADRYDWSKALPLYVEAEQGFIRDDNLSEAAYARVGRIRASVRDHSPQQIAEALNKEIRRSPAKNDTPFRLRALFLKADVETDVDAYSAGVFNADQRHRDWQEILRLSQQNKNHHLESRARGELALLNLLQGDPEAADEVAAVLWESKDAGDLGNELRFRTAIASMYRSAGRAHDALGHLDRAVELAERDRGFAFLPAYFEKAVTLLDVNRLQEAVALIERCAAQARITGSKVINAQGLYLQGRLEFENGNTAKALDLLKTALDIASQAGYHRLISMASLQLSQVYRIRGELWKALDCAESGLRSSGKTGDPFEAILHLHNEGTIRADQGRFAEADHLYSQAIGSLNSLLAKFTSAHARAFIVSRMSDLYSDYFSLSLLKLKDPAKAFAILEQARGRSISDSLRGRLMDPIQADEKTAQNPFEIFEKALSHLQAQLWYKQDPREFRKTLGEIFDLEQHLGSSVEAGRHAIEAHTFSPIALVEIQKVLYPGEVILEYVLLEPSSTCLVISHEDVHGVSLAPRHVIEEAVASYRKEIQLGRQGSQLSHTLYDLLLRPIAGLDQKLRITIVPDGLLHLLPFEAIAAPSGRILIESHMIDYSPSASVTFLLRRNPASHTGRCRFLGVGDARYPSSDDSGSACFGNMLRPARLPGSRAEISSIAKALSGVSDMVTLLGDDVNEGAIKRLDLPDFDILHFAVHGTSDVNFPARSALLLGPDPNKTEDGIFQSWEISRLKLKADLVVLSACDTAVGRVLDQEGVNNLVQAFLLAGARSVVASIWPADDRSTADLMMRFYSYLARGMDKGSALRQAKLDFIQKYRDKALPIYWAGMVMIGDSSDSVLSEHQDKSAEGDVQ